uniref:Uncharacterized protein n=1 Tax=Romanomermis culicivorax TaxID=13658 RepID=A0A915K9Q0_ROMCU
MLFVGYLVLEDLVSIYNGDMDNLPPIQYYGRAKGQRPRCQRLLMSSNRKTVQGSCSLYKCLEQKPKALPTLTNEEAQIPVHKLTTEYRAKQGVPQLKSNKVAFRDANVEDQRLISSVNFPN